MEDKRRNKTRKTDKAATAKTKYVIDYEDLEYENLRIDKIKNKTLVSAKNIASERELDAKQIDKIIRNMKIEENFAFFEGPSSSSSSSSFSP